MVLLEGSRGLSESMEKLEIELEMGPDQEK